MSDEIIKFLKMNDVEYKENQSMAAMSTIKIGSSANQVIYPKDIKEFAETVSFFENAAFKYKILGRMSNVLPPDKKYDGAIIKTDRFSSKYFRENHLFSEAGATLYCLADNARRLGLSGLEQLSGIPGSVGGAIFGNAGAFGREICDLIVSVKTLDPTTGKIEVLRPDELSFKYRESLFKHKRLLILSVVLDLVPSTATEVTKSMRDYSLRRKSSQPCGYPSLGSTFRRPENNVSAGKLIEECGLKGFKIGGAAISEKHAGFIINKGGATAADYLAVADRAQKDVFEKFGINLDKEVEIF